MAFNQGCRGLVPRQKVHYKYLYYFLFSSVDLLNELGSGTTFKELAAGKLKKVTVPLPSLPEQKRIVDILDETFAGISTAVANTEKNVANARQLFESYLNSVFSDHSGAWQTVSLGEIITVQSGFAFRSSEYSSSGHFLVRIGNVQTDGLTLDNPKYVKLDTKTRKFELSKGDLLTSLTGNIGRIAVVGDEHLPAALNQRVARLKHRDSSPVTKGFLFYFCTSEIFRSSLDRMGHGVAQKNVSPKEIAHVKLAFPPVLEQNRIVATLDDLKTETLRLEGIYRHKAKSLAELRQSLLQKAFSGELTALPQDEIETALA